MLGGVRSPYGVPMQLTITPTIQKLIDEHLRSGKYASADEVIAAALHALRHDVEPGDFEPGEWDQLVADGEASGAPLDGDSVLAELREIRARR